MPLRGKDGTPHGSVSVWVGDLAAQQPDVAGGTRALNSVPTAHKRMFPWKQESLQSKITGLLASCLKEFMTYPTSHTLQATFGGLDWWLGFEGVKGKRPHPNQQFEGRAFCTGSESKHVSVIHS